MNWTQLGYSLAGVIALALIARWLRLGESRIASVAQARETAEQMLAGFIAHDAVIGTDGGAALVAGNGAVALLKRHGARIAARRLIAPLQLSQGIEGVRIETGERLFGSVLLFGVTDIEVRAIEASADRPRDVVVTLH
ncbi:MAG: hypothetical protein ACRCS5_02840 [Sphingomonas sp.]|jgi:hypothetical protein|uniref:hypothetical protein n=2 Tax=Pseudomonadota TaxID=1224 RepID=UPI00053DA53A|nr:MULTISPECIES: hypothetical protein [unclassified Sphingomonas]MDR6848319.1 hypothetical protein [Sphingomonas sp. BE137]MDR7258981.1 hypothetical protein [Sphingomonas sp. BE270]